MNMYKSFPRWWSLPFPWLNVSIENNLQGIKVSFHIYHTRLDKYTDVNKLAQPQDRCKLKETSTQIPKAWLECWRQIVSEVTISDDTFDDMTAAGANDNGLVLTNQISYERCRKLLNYKSTIKLILPNVKLKICKINVQDTM